MAIAHSFLDSLMFLKLQPSGEATRVKRQHTETESHPNFAHVGLEMRKQVISTCRNIVYQESHLDKLHQKSKLLEEHRSKGTVPKDLLLPKKKALFEDGQGTLDAILQNAQASLLQHQTRETTRKIVETQSKKLDIEKNILSVFEVTKTAQINALSEGDEFSRSMIEARYRMNLSFYHSQLTLTRENAFLKATNEADKKKPKQSAMDTAPEMRVEDVIDQRLKQLGLINKDRSRSKAKLKRSMKPTISPDRSLRSSRSSRSSSRSSRSSNSSANSRRNSHSPSKGILKKVNKVKFDEAKTQDPPPSNPPPSKQEEGEEEEEESSNSF